MTWQWCQDHSDEILKCGQAKLLNSAEHDWGKFSHDGAGIYLFRENDNYLYLGESLTVGDRIKQHCESGERSTFLKNYSDHRYGDKSSISIAAARADSILEVTIQSLSVGLGRKELEEFGIENLATSLNRLHRGKRAVYYGDCVDPADWDTVQAQSAELISEGVQSFDSAQSNRWAESRPMTVAGIYCVWNHDDLIYFGETTDIAERFSTHSTNTYFSALRRSIGTKIFSFEFIGKKKFRDADDDEISAYLNRCNYASMPIALGRREIEEHLIETRQPILNKKSK